MASEEMAYLGPNHLGEFEFRDPVDFD